MFYQKTSSAGQSFSEVRNAFAESEGLPFSDVLSEEQIQRAFAEEGALFGEGEKVVYTPSITLWAHLSQVLHTGPLRSCAAAVSRVIVLCVVLGRRVPSEDTGAYCRARAKIPVAVVRRLAKQVASELESQVPRSWLWEERHVKMVDGTTLSPCDTVANQEKWPQPPTQKASFKEIFGDPIQSAARRVHDSLKAAECFREESDTLFVSFDQILHAARQQITRVAAYLGIDLDHLDDLDSSLVERIDSATCLERVRQLTEERKSQPEATLRRAGRSRYDPVTQYHVGHAAKAEKRDWRQELTSDEIDAAREILGPHVDQWQRLVS